LYRLPWYSPFSFNIASASLLLHLIAKLVNMIPSKFVWVGGDTHIYENHLEQVNEQLSREPLPLPRLKIEKKILSLLDIENLLVSDIEVINYKYHPKIKAELKTGL
jgi:thymidylate synthase